MYFQTFSSYLHFYRIDFSGFLVFLIVICRKTFHKDLSCDECCLFKMTESSCVFLDGNIFWCVVIINLKLLELIILSRHIFVINNSEALLKKTRTLAKHVGEFS